MIVLTAVFSCLIGVTIGMFLAYQLLVSYEEDTGLDGAFADIDYSGLEGALPSNQVQNDPAVIDDKRSLAGNTDEIRAVFAKRRQAGRA